MEAEGVFVFWGRGGAGDFLNDHGAVVGVTFFGERDEAGEVGTAHFRVHFPDGGIEVGHDDGWAAGDGLDVDVHRRAEFADLGDDGFEIYDTIAQDHPLDGCAAGDFVDDGIAEVDGYGEGAEGFDGFHGVFEDEDGVAGIEVGADKVFAGGFDDLAGLPGVQVFVIFDGDFDVGVHGLGADGAEEFDGSLHVVFDGAGREVGAVAGQEGADDGGAHGGGALDVVEERLDGVVEGGIGAGEDGGAAGFQVEIETGGLVFHGTPVGGVFGLGVEGILEEDGVEFEAGGVVEELGIGPFEGAETVGVEADGDLSGDGHADDYSMRAGWEKASFGGMSVVVDRQEANPYFWDMDMVALTPERKAQLDDYAQRHGQDAATALDEVVAAYLEWEEQDYREAVKGIRAGYEDFLAGRFRLVDEAFGELRVNYFRPR